MRWIGLTIGLLLVGCGSKTGLLFDPPRDAGPPEECNGLDDDGDGFVDDGIICFFLDGEPLLSFPGEACGADWYGYGEPDAESANPTPDIRRADAVVVGTQWRSDCDGANVGLIADRPGSTPGRAGGGIDVAWQISPPESAGLVVIDDPRVVRDGMVIREEDECFHDDASGVGGCALRWQDCCTDGFLLGPWTTDGCVTMTVTRVEDREPDPGVDSLVVLDGTRAELSREFGESFEICSQFRPAR